LTFIVDSSGSIGQRNYTKIKTFVSTLASKFRISRDGSRAAVILYSDYAKVEIDFGDQINIEDFHIKVASLPHQRGRTRIDRALQMAHVKLYGPGGSARRGVHRIVVVLTDGQQTRDPDSVPLEKAAAALRREGAYIFAVGIGSYVSKKELRLMTERDEDVVMATSFDDLLAKVGTFSKTTCQGRKLIFCCTTLLCNK
jgi:Mg-chelatase subunit ChlD